MGGGCPRRRGRPGIRASRGESRACGSRIRALSMSAVLRVQVPPKGDHLNRSEPQLRKGDQSWGGSGKRNRGPMNKKRIRGGAGRGEREDRRKAPMVKVQAT